MSFQRLSREERNELVVRYLPLVKTAALRLMGRLPDHITYDELFSSGVVGLLDAVDKYDPSFGIPFESYALIRIRGSMIDDIRSKDVVPRGVRAKVAEIEQVIERLEQRLGRPPEDEEIANELGMDVSEYHETLDNLRGLSLSYSLEHLLDSGQHPDSLTEDGGDVTRQVYLKEIKKSWPKQ
ncbi:RNA polymerase sigma factor, sigma-70 family [Thermodesulforhabdus norvegica]|uniref:RNA polymerase sigma factor, sigma-70 family n=1 Tax=Thermodesulforhabdus norvegica TaxID=39841 RepID=A0A1I4R521_9BACT|nr:RNA polymerase sigma factor, sigma-70 family [Thermodesulforhabdus norvegica]